MVPQGADIVALQLDATTIENLVSFHRPRCSVQPETLATHVEIPTGLCLSIAVLEGAL